MGGRGKPRDATAKNEEIGLHGDRLGGDRRKEKGDCVVPPSGPRLRTAKEGTMKQVWMLGLLLALAACGDSVPLVPFL
jgi:hypothetical protein